MLDQSNWLRQYHEWRSRQRSTADYYREEQQASALAKSMAAQFTVQEMSRLATYRVAVRAGFYNDN